MKTIITTMKTSCTTIICLLALLALAGCSSLEDRSQKLQLGMTKQSVIDLLGSDYTTTAARVDADGSAISILKFHEDRKEDLFLYFRNDTLVQWGDTAALKAMPATATGTPTTPEVQK
jgi:hypothetical protein